MDANEAQPTCDLCGAPLRPAPFSTTIWQNRYVCTKNINHVFSKDTAAGHLLRVSPLVTTLMVGTVMAFRIGSVVHDLTH